MVYLCLFHGRKTRDEEMVGWGDKGPILGPFDFVHTTYGSLIHLGKPQTGEDLGDLTIVDGLVYYDGMYYGDWSIFGQEVFEKFQTTAEPFDEVKATPVPRTNIEHYIANGGCSCPYCGSDKIEGSDISTNVGNMYQDIYCQNCGRQWTDEYTLTGITEEPKEP